MTTITRLRVLQFSCALQRPFITNVRRADSIDVVLVEATDSAGRIGWGEAPTSWRVTGESAPSVAAVISGPLADVVLGSAPGEDLAAQIATAVWGNAAARSAVECAVRDLATQAHGLPFIPAESAVPARTVRTDMTLSAAPAREVAELAAQHVDAGFRTLKLKAASGHDVIAAVHAVRTAVGNDITIRIDANQAWDAATATRTIHALEDAGSNIAFVEQPVPARDLNGLARVTAAVNTEIMADESVRTAEDVHELAERGAVDLVNIKLAKTGGIAAAIAAARAAQDLGLGVVFGCMMEANIGVAAAAHLAAAVAPDTVHDLDAALWLREVPLTGGVAFDNDSIVLNASAGLGMTGISEGVIPTVLADVHSTKVAI